MVLNHSIEDGKTIAGVLWLAATRSPRSASRKKH